jgi:recombination protein RecA
LVEKSGSWFSYDGQRIGQGRENAKGFLRANPEMAATLEKALRENAGILAGALLEDRSTDEDAEDAE